MATQRIYVCPEHPDKPYTSWRKFRGHWSTQHRGEECPPREDFLQMREKEEVLEAKKEAKEALKEAAEEREYQAAPGEFILPDDPVPRLSKILEVHGVTPDLVAQILGVFQIHPGYQNNPVNLHYLLTAKLPRKLHTSIPMIISAFTTQESTYPEGGMPGMIPGMGGPQVAPPYFMGGGYSPYYYPTTYGLPQYYRPPMGGREPPEEESSRGTRTREKDPLKDAVALLGLLFDLKGKITGDQGGGNEQAAALFEGFRATLEEVSKDSKEQQDKLLEKIETSEENRRKDLESIKEQLHQAEKARLEDRIESLEESKDEARSEGLGQLIREAGGGAGAQLEGIRTSLTQGAERLGNIAERLVTTEGLPKGPSMVIERGKAPVSRTVNEAAGLAEAEDEVEALAQALSQEGGSK